MPSASRLSRWRRTAAGVRPSRADRPAAVTGPFSRISRAMRPLVLRSDPRDPAVAARVAADSVAADSVAANAGTALPPVPPAPATPASGLAIADPSTRPTVFTTSLCRNSFLAPNAGPAAPIRDDGGHGDSGRRTADVDALRAGPRGDLLRSRGPAGLRGGRAARILARLLRGPGRPHRGGGRGAGDRLVLQLRPAVR